MEQMTRTRQLVSYSLSDVHCHLDLCSNPKEAVEESRRRNVQIMITAGSDRKSNLKMQELTKYDGVFGVVGISPDFSSADNEFISEMPGLIKTNRRIIGIGEIGLDLKIAEKVGMEIQKKALMRQIDIANELELPIVVHSRGALDDVIKILKEKEVKRAVFHFFEGDEEKAKLLAKAGYLISIPPIESGRRKRIIKEIDLSSIAAETDSPVVGKIPADVAKVIDYISRLKNMGFEEAGEAVTETIKDYFYI